MYGLNLGGASTAGEDTQFMTIKICDICSYSTFVR